MSHPRFTISKSTGGQFSFHLTASNGAIVLTSERYTSHSGALSGVDSVRTNAPINERFDRRISQRNDPYFVLRASNGEVIGTSEMYSSTSARDEGIRAVQRAAAEAHVEG